MSDVQAVQQRGRGRPEREIPLGLFRDLCRLQCTEEEIAGFFQVTKRTIIRRLKQPQFREAWEYGKSHGRASLRRLQWQHAQRNGSGAVAMTIHLSKHWLGETDSNLVAVQNNITNNFRSIEMVLVSPDGRQKLIEGKARSGSEQASD